MMVEFDPDISTERETIFKEYLEIVPHIKFTPHQYVFRYDHPAKDLTYKMSCVYPRYASYRNIWFIRCLEGDIGFVYKMVGFPEITIPMQDLLKVFTIQEIQALSHHRTIEDTGIL